MDADYYEGEEHILLWHSLFCRKFITFKENCEPDSAYFVFVSSETGLTMLTTRHLKSLHVLWKILFDN